MRLTIVTLGNVDPSVLEHVRRNLRAKFSMPVQIGGDIRAPENSLSSYRKQYEANLILSDLEKNFDDKVLVLTNNDIYTQALNYIFGLARIKGKSAIVSMFRLNPAQYKSPEDNELLKERLVKESIHEMGHVFGLQHCKEQGCVMNISNNIRDIDNKSTNFCHMCQIGLSK